MIIFFCLRSRVKYGGRHEIFFQEQKIRREGIRIPTMTLGDLGGRVLTVQQRVVVRVYAMRLRCRQGEL
jgi:hypothetical protein